MQNLRLLIAEHNAQLRQTMMDFFQAQGSVSSVIGADNGVEALAYLASEPVDVVVMDLILPQMDGFTLLHEINSLSLNPMPKIIAATALSRDDIVMRSLELGVLYFLVKPYRPEDLLRYVQEAAGLDHPFFEKSPLASPRVSPSQNLDERLSSLFLASGIPAHIKGYAFLRDAVKLVARRPEYINNITKELYPAVASLHDTTASKVERAMRHAIEVAWGRGRIDELNREIGCAAFTKEDKPTNGELIAMLADKLSMGRSA